MALPEHFVAGVQRRLCWCVLVASGIGVRPGQSDGDREAAAPQADFLIMVESPESMQGLPGENPARYNEVGAGLPKTATAMPPVRRAPTACEFSGMGGQGYKFDTVSVGTASQTQTQSQTVVTSTMTVTQTALAHPPPDRRH